MTTPRSEPEPPPAARWWSVPLLALLVAAPVVALCRCASRARTARAQRRAA